MAQVIIDGVVMAFNSAKKHSIRFDANAEDDVSLLKSIYIGNDAITKADHKPRFIRVTVEAITEEEVE